MARVYALRRLAEQIPAAAEPELTADDRQALASLQRDHIDAVLRQFDELTRVLRPAVGLVAPTSAQAVPAWQPATENLLQSARQVDKFMAVIFGAAPPERSSSRLASQLTVTLAEFRGKLEAFARAVK